MDLFAIFGKKAEGDGGGKAKKENDLKILEIYSGMRVVVEDLEGQVLFIARLPDCSSIQTQRWSGIWIWRHSRAKARCRC